MTGFNFSKNAPGMYSPSVLFVFKCIKAKIIIIIALKYLGWETSLLKEVS